jgi:hypothetical protein
MYTFEDIDHENDQSLDQELNSDQLFTVSGSMTYLFDHVMSSDKDALLAFFDLLTLMMCFTDLNFKQNYRHNGVHFITNYVPQLLVTTQSIFLLLNMFLLYML